MNKSLIIGVTGGSGSGKTLFIKRLIEQFSPSEICLISQDNYYKKREDQPIDENGVKNFDLPESINHQQFINDVRALSDGKVIHQLEYTYNNPDLKPRMLVLNPAPVLIVEGIMAFYWKEIRETFDIGVFIDAKDLVKVKRRIIRDAKERGYDLDDVLYRYEYHVAPFYEKFVKPLRQEVDIVIPNNDHFEKGLSVLSGYIQNYLSSRGESE